MFELIKEWFEIIEYREENVEIIVKLFLEAINIKKNNREKEYLSYEQNIMEIYEKITIERKLELVNTGVQMCNKIANHKQCGKNDTWLYKLVIIYFENVLVQNSDFYENYKENK